MANAVWYDLIVATQSAIRALGLTYSAGALPSAQVYARKILTDRNTTSPFVMVAQGAKEQITDEDFEDYGVSYPVAVGIAFAGNQDYSLNNYALQWRESIIDLGREFETDIVPLITSQHTFQVSACRVEPDAALLPELWQHNADVGAITLWFDTTRLRS